jgi:hypothetical protein
MIPVTYHGLPALVCRSALQKCIRRGMEREAMLFACELFHTSKAFCSMVTNCLEVVAHEDIDCLAAPTIVPFVAAAAQQARDWYDPDKPGKSRMAIGNIIRLLCRAPKSREGDHFQMAVGLANALEDELPEIPDWALDMHTPAGKRLGRGVEHFLTESTKLVPDPGPDRYQSEAHRLLEIKEASGGHPPIGKGRKEGYVKPAQQQLALAGSK